MTAFTVNGGTGNDELFGTDGADRLFGGDGNDFVDGNAGADLGDLGSGDDVFRWDGGDGSDVVEGRGGTDTMLFNGADIAENVDVSANGGRSRFFRTQGNIVMDNDDVEVLAFNARGGADDILIHDLRATDVRHVNLDLGTAAGAVDGAIDNVTVEGGGGDDVIRVGGSAAAGVVVTGPAGAVNITRQEAGDKLTVNALGGRRHRQRGEAAGERHHASSPTAATATTCSSAGPATTRCSAAPARTSSSAAPAPTRSTAAPTKTSSCRDSPCADVRVPQSFSARSPPPQFVPAAARPGKGQGVFRVFEITVSEDSRCTT